MWLAIQRARSGAKPRASRVPGRAAWKASSEGNRSRTVRSSTSSEWAPRDLKPEYQMSNGSRGRPIRAWMSAARSFTSCDARTETSSASASATVIWRSRSKRRVTKVGAVGENGSISRAARK